MIDYIQKKTPEEITSAAENLTQLSGRSVRVRDIMEFAIEGKPNSTLIEATRVVVNMRILLRDAGIIPRKKHRLKRF